MQLDADVCYRALQARDARFDGRFFTAVRSTGVYCRPICPASTPRRENCWFVPCAAAAQEAGFRPCLRCRPEASPGTPAWLGSSATVSRALRLIGEGALDTAGVDALAARLGMGERQLRRLFVKHLGASPRAVAHTRRVLHAKKLIDETQLPMSQVALATGFTSIRRFNAAIRATYATTPRALRARRARAAPAGDASEIQLVLPFRPPLHWESLIGFLALRATPGVEVVNGDSYCRSVRVAGATGLVRVRPVSGANHLLAGIRLPEPAGLIAVTEGLRRVFDLGADPHEIAAHLAGDPLLGPRVEAAPGLRIPGAWDGFELAVRAVLGQQVTVKGATTLAGRLAERFGAPLDVVREGEPSRLFPGPSELAGADLTAIGLPRARAGAIGSLARAVAAGEIALDATRAPEETRRALAALPGIGDWTAQYVAMRALGEPDAFPASDLGLRRALAPRSTPLTARELAVRAEPWRPWRAYAAMYLWAVAPPGATRTTRLRRSLDRSSARVVHGRG